MSSSEPNLRTVVEGFDPMFSFVGISFRHQRILGNRWLWTIFLLIAAENVGHLYCDIAPYDRRHCLLTGNISVYLLGAQYYYFEPVLWSFKAASITFLAQHLINGNRWLQDIEVLYVQLINKYPQFSLWPTGQLAEASKKTRTFMVVSVLVVFGPAHIISSLYSLIALKGMSIVDRIPIFYYVNFYVTIYMCLQTFFVGLVYLVSRFVTGLGSNFNSYLLDFLRDRRNFARMGECFDAFSMFVVVVRECNIFMLRVYIIYITSFSVFVPVFIYNIVFAELVNFVRVATAFIFVAFTLNIVFLSHILGRVYWKLEAGVDRLYEKIISNQIKTSNKRRFVINKLTYKIVDFFKAVNGNVITVTFLGQPINVTTCIGVSC